MKRILLMTAMALPMLLRAQTTPLLYHWDVAVYFGPYLSNLSGNLEKMLAENSFEPPDSWINFGNSNKMTTKKPIYQVCLEHFTKNSISYKLMVSSLSGHVAGFSNSLGDLTVHYTQTTSSFLIGYQSKLRITRISAGPSLHFTKLSTVDYSSCAPFSDLRTILGFAIEAGLRFPAKTLVFFDFNIQYQFIGKQALGNYDFGQNRIIDLGKSPSGYLAFNFGIGIRLGK